MSKVIHYNKPYVTGREIEFINKAVYEFNKLSGDGEFTRLCSEHIEKNLNCQKVLLTHSCTAALELAALLLDIKPGDEIIMPSFTFVSTANAFVLRGATPVFVDIDINNLCLDINLIESCITHRTKAIIPVHYAGMSCDMSALLKLASKYNIEIIEDAAQAYLSTHNNQYLGSFGGLGTFSFHDTKNIISGEGGALVINNQKYFERAEIIREKGTDRSKFFRGEVDKYTWKDVGSSFLPSELTAAYLYAQLLKSEKIISNRKQIFNRYHELLLPLSDSGYIILPSIDSDSSVNNGHIFYVLTQTAEERGRLIEEFKQAEIHAIFHYIPLHSSPMGQKVGRVATSMNVTNSVSDRVLRLPIYVGMTENEILRVATLIYNFYGLKLSHVTKK